ncbi:MAG: glycoside hydrolase family 9 protein [Lachnospiraceae bacterium]|nr:glycoside hydrolase family 9 protein [Lachnospiraceae bacterium]
MTVNRIEKFIFAFVLVLVPVSMTACRIRFVRPQPSSSQTQTVTTAETQTDDEETENDVESETVIGFEPERDASETGGDNLIPGGDFSEKNSAWSVYKESGGSADISIGQGKLTLNINSCGVKAHSVQLYCDGFELLEGGRYTFSCNISSDTARYFEWRIQQNGGDYHPYAQIEKVEIGPEPITLKYEFVMQEPSDPSPRMCFNLGDAGSEQGLAAHTIVLDDVVLTADLTAAKTIDRQQVMNDININQIGYHPGDEKRAVFRNSDNGDEYFEVINAGSGDSVYRGSLKKGLTFGSSGDSVSYADFSSVTDKGTYVLSAPKSGKSYEFTIADDVYDDALIDSLRMLYLQRCGCKLPKEFAGAFSHEACHTEKAMLYGGTEYIDVSGGWHDAGDYGRYTVPGAKAVADLLLAYEMYPESFGDANNIPESGNGIPDVLDEARYELDWLLKMQAPSGGVYHKVTGLNFDGVVKSDECIEKLYVMPTSKTATADFAAAMYMASRVYRGIDDEFSQRCMDAADRALEDYTRHIGESNYTNPSDVKTGEYGDGCSVDEYLWAICEGYKSSGDARFEKMLGTVDLSKMKNDGFGWADVSGYAYYAYLSAENPMKSAPELKKRFYEYCDNVTDISLRGEAYGSSIKLDYPWGSNMTIANNGMALLMAYGFTGKDDYRLAAKRQLDYLMGTNTTSYCFLTGYGTQTPQHPHHRPSQVVGECMKGMLVGGPDSNLEDPYAKAVLSGLPKAKCYIDNEQSYSCNEVTIYWNSPLCFLLAGLK